MSDMLTAEERMLVERAMASPLKGLVYRLAERVRAAEVELGAAREQITILKRIVQADAELKEVES